MDHIARSQRTAFQKALHVLFPFLAHRHHRRYEGVPHHFVFDTALSIAILALIGWNVFLLTTHAAILQPSAAIAMEAPDTTASGAMIDVVVVLQNSDEALSDASIGLTYPSTFLFSSATREPVSATTNRWEFSAVEPNEEIRFTVTGQIVGAPGSDLPFKVLLAAQAASGAVARFANATVRVTTSALTITLSGPSTLASGADGSFTAVLKNVSAETLRDVSVVLDAPKAFSLTASSPRAAKQRMWRFTTLDANEETTIAFTAATTSATTLATTLTITAGLRAGDALVAQGSATLKVAITAAPTAETVVTQSSPAVQFATEARYTSASGITVGFGPVPLKVGQTTGFRIFFVLQKPDASYTSAVMTATLPQNVAWLGNGATTAGDAITYDAAMRTIRWTVNPIRRATDILSGGFDVAVTPSLSDVGRSLPLLSASTLTLAGATTTTVRTPALSTTTSNIGTKGKVTR